MKLLVAMVAAGALLTGLATTLFGDHSYTVTAYFVSAEGLTAQNDVVINGSRVGKVVSVSIAPDAPSVFSYLPTAGRGPSSGPRDCWATHLSSSRPDQRMPR